MWWAFISFFYPVKPRYQYQYRLNWQPKESFLQLVYPSCELLQVLTFDRLPEPLKEKLVVRSLVDLECKFLGLMVKWQAFRTCCQCWACDHSIVNRTDGQTDSNSHYENFAVRRIGKYIFIWFYWLGLASSAGLTSLGFFSNTWIFGSSKTNPDSVASPILPAIAATHCG